MMLWKKIILSVICLPLFPLAQAQSLHRSLCFAHAEFLAIPAAYDWSKVARIDIDITKYPVKYKVVTDILNSMAADGAGRQILDNIAQSGHGPVSIRDKDALLDATKVEGVSGTFSADYGLQVIKHDMQYNPIDNEVIINFDKSGEMLGFDEHKHLFFKISLNNTIASALEAAGEAQLESVTTCRSLLAKMDADEHFLFNNYKDLMGEKFSSDDIERCRHKKITIHNFGLGKDLPYTFTDVVTDALIAYRDYAADVKANAYELDSRIMPLAQRYTDKLGEPRRSREPVFTVRLGENRSRALQFGPVTGTDYIALGSGQQNVYKEFSVFYDTENRQKVDNPTALTRIKEEYIAQLRHNTEALNSPKMLEYVDRLKKFFNKDHRPASDYKAVLDAELRKVMRNNPYIEGADKVIEAEVLWNETKETGKKK
jgi:hypothetical protein